MAKSDRLPLCLSLVLGVLLHSDDLVHPVWVPLGLRQDGEGRQRQQRYGDSERRGGFPFMRCRPLNRLETCLEEREEVHCWDSRELAAAPAVAVRGMRAKLSASMSHLRSKQSRPRQFFQSSLSRILSDLRERKTI